MTTAAMSGTETLPTPTGLPEPALAELRAAAAVLENSSLAIRLASAIGSSVEALKRQLPRTTQQVLDAILRRALDQAMRTALKLRPARNPTPLPAHWLHRGLVTASGMAGGALGLPGTVLELPVTTTLLLRQIATIAAEEGEDLTDPETQAECLKVFALSGDSPVDDEAETGYFAVRLALADTMKGAVGRNLASFLPGFLGKIATRFGVPVTIKLSAQALPLLGAAAGATMNLVFLEHFRGIARAHFTVRRLERRFGAALVRAHWPVRE